MPITQEDHLKSSLRIALCAQTVAIRDRRRLIEERWLQDRRAWMAVPDRAFTPSDSAPRNYRIPAARRVIERAVVRAVKLLTPKVKWFETAPMSGFDIPQDKLANVDAYMWYVMRKKIKTRTMISQLVRCMVLYGLCALKTSIAVQNGMVWPAQRAVDPFSLYLYPETATNTDEWEDIFEDFLFSYEKYKTFVDKGIVDNIPRSALTKPNWPYHLVERIAYQGITDPNANVDVIIERTKRQLEESTNAYVSLTEKWHRHEGSLYQVYIAWNLTSGPRIVGFFKSSYDDPMYRIAIHRALPNELYTNSQGSDITELDEIQGDMFNQFIQAVDWEQGLVAIGGADGMRRDTLKMKGRALWDFGPNMPKEVLEFINPPNTSNNFLRAWQVSHAMMQSLGGAGTIAEGQPGRNMPRSGEAVSSLINLSMADIQDLAEMVEQDVLTPGLSDIYKISNFIPDDQLMSIPGGLAFYSGGFLNQDTKSNILKKQDILGDYEFEWVGSLQFQDEAIRAQRLMIFLNMIPTLLPILNQQGYTFNLPELIQMIWRSGIGERGLSKVIVTLQEMQALSVQNMQPMQGQQPNSSLPPDVQALLNQVLAQQPQGQNQQPNQRSNRVPGLQYNLPTVTNGFIR